MKKRTLVLLILLVSFAALASAGAVTQKGTLTATCPTCDEGGNTVDIVGTGYQRGGHNELLVVVWDSPNPVICGTPDKKGNFSCTTTIDGPGWYIIVAYENSRTIVAATSILID